MQEANQPATELQATVDASALYAALTAGGALLDSHLQEVNSLNVFPVPDGDTGTNMSMTMRAALAEVHDTVTVGAGDLAHTVAHGALMGARGNSGVILSQILRGFARELDSVTLVDAPLFASALTEASATAYKGVMRPVEGTILTVVRESAEAAEAAVLGGVVDLVGLMAIVVSSAKESLERTPTLLPVLAEAGVVDSGGTGLVYIFEGMLRYLKGEAVEFGEEEAALEQHAHLHMDEEFNFDVQFIIQGQALDMLSIRERIDTYGDSTLVVGDEKAIKVHVHCDHPGEVLEYGITQGHVTAVIIENMQLQFEEFKEKSEAGARIAGEGPATPLAVPYVPKPKSDTTVVAVVAGEGMEKVFRSLGVDSVVPGGQTMNPSTQDILQAIDGAGSDRVIVLPNNKNIILAATQAQALCERETAVVPTKTMAQGIAALLAFNYQAKLEENEAVMTEACEMVETIEITRAVRDAQVNGLAVREGQIIGLLNGDLVVGGDTPEIVALEVMERLGADDYEIVTIYYGEDMDEAAAAALSEKIEAQHEDLEVDVLCGGQPHYHYVISVE